jgi:hypothetical protein
LAPPPNWQRLALTKDSPAAPIWRPALPIGHTSVWFSFAEKELL